MTATPKRKPPKPPADLEEPGVALWATLVAAYDLDASEIPMLTAACRQADDIALLEEAIARDGCMVEGSAGQPRLNAALTEVRQGRVALQKLLGAIAWPVEGTGSATLRQRQARNAAHVRWQRA